MLLQTDGAARQRLCFRLESGGREASALSGAARDACLHGVLADEGGEPRCSLNLRFGLHSPGMEGEFPAGRVGYGGAGEALGRRSRAPTAPAHVLGALALHLGAAKLA